VNRSRPHQWLGIYSSALRSAQGGGKGERPGGRTAPTVRSKVPFQLRATPARHDGLHFGLTRCCLVQSPSGQRNQDQPDHKPHAGVLVKTLPAHGRTRRDVWSPRTPPPPPRPTSGPRRSTATPWRGIPSPQTKRLAVEKAPPQTRPPRAPSGYSGPHTAHNGLVELHTCLGLFNYQ